MKDEHNKGETDTQTHRAAGGDGGQQDADEPPPGRSDEQRGDEDPGGHSQPVGPAGQEEVGEREHAQGEGVVGACRREQ